MEYRLLRARRKSVAIVVENGEVIVKAPWFVPRMVIDMFVQSKREWIERRLQLDLERSLFYYHLGRRYERDGVDVEALWMETMHSYVVPRAWELAERFGERPSRIRISKAKRRWGSCSSRGSINLSYRLAQLPHDLIDYVIVHELCHLRHMDHSKAFWDLVESRFAHYRRDRERLRMFW